MTSRCSPSRFAAPRAVALVLASLAAALAAGSSMSGTVPGAEVALRQPTASGVLNVIVRQRDPGDQGPRRLVGAAGGRVGAELPLIGGFAASVPAAALPRLAGWPGVVSVSRDRVVRVAAAETAQGGGPASVHRAVVGADRLAAGGVTGQGVTVALVDTGVADVPELRDRLAPVGAAACQNFSAEPDCGDGFGHGTFMAGLVSSVAPGARILSVKIAGRDSSDVSKVLAAIQWVVSNADQHGIKVLNLSLGTDSTQDWRTDPLNYAVERAWAAGITVVAAASNRGPGAGTVTKPGDDPWVLTVGAIDDRGTPGLGDDVLPGFSARGPTRSGRVAKPDVVAPGAHLLSLRAPGSLVEHTFPLGSGRYRRGSGTSMAAAVVSGVAALVLDARPSWSPDRLKHALATTARPAPSPDRSAVGHGVVDGWRAVFDAPPGLANQGLAHSDGRGSLDASRGSVRVTGPDGLLVAGERTAQSALLAGQLAAWDPIGYATGDWTAPTWPLSPWAVYGFLPTAWASEFTGKNWQGAWYGSWR
jgi:serine protease AprX